MSMSKHLVASYVGIILACCILVTPSFAAELVVNGGFETGDFTGWSTIPAPSNSLYGVSTTDPHNGSFAAYFGATGTTDDTILQSVLPTVSGDWYTISFWLAHPYDVSTNDFTASWDGSPILLLVDVGRFDYTNYSFTLPANGPSTTLQFSSLEVPAYFYLDDVSVQPVPEPSTLVLFSMGVFGFLASVWRKRKQAA